jgi:hypothetical protein
MSDEWPTYKKIKGLKKVSIVVDPAIMGNTIFMNQSTFKYLQSQIKKMQKEKE